MAAANLLPNNTNHSMKIRAKLIGDSGDNTVEIKLIISHPMETGRKKDDFGQLIAAHFIKLLVITLNDKTVLETQWGTAISKNPYLTIRARGAKLGDKVTVTWQDNLGETGSEESIVISNL